MITKFKFWDKDNNEFILFPHNIVLNIDGTVEGIEYEMPREGNVYNDITYFELLQSTGLFDKNGKEIFEGDIVKFKNPYDKRFSAIGVVVWREDKACFGIDMEGTTEQFEVYRITAQNYLTVIGNIHQDERLLGEE